MNDLVLSEGKRSLLRRGKFDGLRFDVQGLVFFKVPFTDNAKWLW